MHNAATARAMLAFVGLAALALPVAAAPVSGAATACSSDTFSVDGAPLVVEVCAPAGPAVAGKVTLTERFTVKGQPPLVRLLIVDVLPKAESSRSIDDVALAQLGIAGTLHVTVVYRTGSARLEHALLIPGAVGLK